MCPWGITSVDGKDEGDPGEPPREEPGVDEGVPAVIDFFGHSTCWRIEPRLC